MKKKKYPINVLAVLVQRINEQFAKEMKQQGWCIGMFDREEYHSQFEHSGDFFAIDYDTESGLLESAEDADPLAKALGIIVAEDGLILGYMGRNFVEEANTIL